MDNPFRTPEDYELFLYTITERFPAVWRSTITFVRIGATLARVRGELYLGSALRIIVRERLLYDRLPLTIEWYGCSSPIPDVELLKCCSELIK